MRIRLGANPIIWSNDMRELGAETPLETCLAEARQIGFEGMELGHKFPRDARELAAILDRFGLACVSGWYSAELLARDARAEISYAKDVRAVVCERARTENWSFLRAVLEGVFTVPGDGSIDFERVFRELRNYSGWVILEAEQDPRVADPMAYASLGFRNLRRLLAEHMQ